MNNPKNALMQKLTDKVMRNGASPTQQRIWNDKHFGPDIKPMTKSGSTLGDNKKENRALRKYDRIDKRIDKAQAEDKPYKGIHPMSDEGQSFTTKKQTKNWKKFNKHIEKEFGDKSKTQKLFNKRDKVQTKLSKKQQQSITDTGFTA